MKPSSENEITKPVRDMPEGDQDIEITGQAFDLTGDSDYEKLMEHYQKGEKDLSLMVLNTLEKRYPQHPALLRIKEDLQLKSSVRDLTAKFEKGEKREKRKGTLNLAIFAIVGTILVMLAFYLTSRFLITRTVEEVVDQNVGQLTSLQGQVESLLNRGRPGPAAEIIETMREINPNWGALPELTERVETLLDLEARYNQALALVAAGNRAEALAIFQSIEEQQPGLWDVRRQIDTLDDSVQVNTLLEEGANAFASGDWGTVISAYESAMALDPSIGDPRVTEQLLGAYLNDIERILQDQNASIEDIETAEAYYRKAAGMLPQGGGFASQRARLDELDDLLQERKYARMARDIYSDPNQNLSTVGSAVSYLKRAAAINPENDALNLAVQNAESYQTGFSHFAALDWAPAIEAFNAILASESEFLKPHARVLLYEAYFGYGKSLAGAGDPEGALTALEGAEDLAWAERGNLMKLFQVQLLIGDINWGAGNFEAAFAAYQDALENIDGMTRLEAAPDTQRNYVEALSFAEAGLYDNAYENFQQVRDTINVIYTFSAVTVENGSTLAFFANNNGSTIHAVNQANDLPEDVVVTFSGTLQVPSIEN